MGVKPRTGTHLAKARYSCTGVMQQRAKNEEPKDRSKRMSQISKYKEDVKRKRRSFHLAKDERTQMRFHWRGCTACLSGSEVTLCASMSVCVQVCVGVRVCTSVCVSVRVIEREEMEQQLSGEEKTSPRRRKK